MIVKVEIIKNIIKSVAYMSLIDLEGVKLQLEKTLGSENVQRQLSRQKSSDSGSLTGSLSRSIDGSESKLRRRHYLRRKLARNLLKLRNLRLEA
jgi:hypothetical protein